MEQMTTGTPHGTSIDAKHIAAYGWNQWTEIDLTARFARFLLTETSMSNPSFMALRDKAYLLSNLCEWSVALIPKPRH